ncbi:hypothetical protein NLX86_08440 [Streptomyces sp. A3M-1-3]|uniref:hypothetical protein n=1 Tax=Streptomyces sp. A3M-1-3 TaxID=2962044 RepID=UPI0020B821B4|nr:hypothetical protein [Streptomyces sp. A3M-1-3]MCP3818140.1 hypothetical protein [Streptomyces sp. A3M-1-3]
MATTELAGRSRVTVFPLEGLTVAYTTQSSDARGLGDVAVVGVIAPDTATGDHLWRLAASMFTNPPPGQAQARWILTQCSRARTVKAPAHQDLPDAKWSAPLGREFGLDALFANHMVLRTGRFAFE